MKYRKLGNSGMHVSEISFGSMFFGGAQYKATDDPVSKEKALICLKKATDHGINYLDCADIYGAYGPAETILGEFLKDFQRSDFVLSSKVMFPMSTNANDRGLSKKHISESIDKSLDRMKTNYLDLYYCHRYDYSTPLEETVRAMNDLIDEGKILYWGTSNWTAAQLERAFGIARCLGLRGPVCDQPKYNLMLRSSADCELKYTVEHYKLGIVAYKILADGLFTSKYIGKILEDLSEQELQSITRYIVDNESKPSQIQFEKVHRLNLIASELEITLPQLAYAWCLSNPIVSTALMSTRSPDRIEENIQAVEISLNKEVLGKIDELLENKPYGDKAYMYESFAYYEMVIEKHPNVKTGIFPFNPRSF